MNALLKRVRWLSILVVLVGGATIAAAAPPRVLVAPCDSCQWSLVWEWSQTACLAMSTPHCAEVHSCNAVWNWVTQEWAYDYYFSCVEAESWDDCVAPYVCM